MARSQESLTDEQREDRLVQTMTLPREKQEFEMFETDAPQKFTFLNMNAGSFARWQSYCICSTPG